MRWCVVTAHLVEYLSDMSVDEREKWSYGMKDLVKDGGSGSGASAAKPANQNAPPIPDTGNLQVILQLQVMEEDEKAWPTVVNQLEDLRRNGKTMPGCVHFEIYECFDDREILILQTWEDQVALDDFHKASFFQVFDNLSSSFSFLLLLRCRYENEHFMTPTTYNL